MPSEMVKATIAQSNTVIAEWKHGERTVSITFQPVSDLSPEVERRRRLLTRTVPLALIAIVAFAIGAATGAPGSPDRDAAGRFAEAWAAGNFAAMYRELNASSRASVSADAFANAYREAA